MTGARIVIAMLRFVQAAARAGPVGGWRLWPSQRILDNEALAALLDAADKPLVVGALAERGGVVVSRIADADEQARPMLERELRAQQEYLREKLALLAPHGVAPVRLVVHDAELVVSSADLEEWARDHLVTSCGWTVRGDDGDPHAPLRMLLHRPDGA